MRRMRQLFLIRFTFQICPCHTVFSATALSKAETRRTFPQAHRREVLSFRVEVVGLTRVRNSAQSYALHLYSQPSVDFGVRPPQFYVESDGRLRQATCYARNRVRSGEIAL